jgi:hypothetical protein
MLFTLVVVVRLVQLQANHIFLMHLKKMMCIKNFQSHAKARLEHDLESSGLGN